MLRFILYLTLSPLALCAQLQLPEEPIKFLALGDSYTIGQSVAPQARWPEQLADSLESRGYTIDTRRIIATTGWRTDNLINAIKNQDLESQDYNLVSLLIGVNNQYQSRPFSQYVTEFPALVDSAIRYAGGDKSRVFIVSIPDYAYTPFGQGSSNPAEISQELDVYNEYNQHVADSLQITYFNITPISRQGLNQPSYVANDGLHPSALQYTQWVKLMLAYIDQQSTGTDVDLADDGLRITITPNPTTGDILISIPDAFAGDNISFRIFNLTGKVMRNETMNSASQQFSVQDLPDGLYLMEIVSEGRYAIKKFMKKGG